MQKAPSGLYLVSWIGCWVLFVHRFRFDMRSSTNERTLFDHITLSQTCWTLEGSVCFTTSLVVLFNHAHSQMFSECFEQSHWTACHYKLIVTTFLLPELSQRNSLSFASFCCLHVVNHLNGYNGALFKQSLLNACMVSGQCSIKSWCSDCVHQKVKVVPWSYHWRKKFEMLYDNFF